MDTKESIEFLKLYEYNHIDEPCQEEDGFNKVIALLKQGEKYRQMWESIKTVCMVDKKIQREIRQVVKDIEKGEKEVTKYLRRRESNE